MEDNKTIKGGISVETEHLFPIIKKWLYSEKEIFLREIVSNACDAVTKLKRLTSLGEVHGIDDDYKITVTADKEAGTLTVSDNGIGMTEEEVQKYICQIALSGAMDFIQKYEEDNSSGIIGHFGLGFYSAFMVSDEVEVITKSYTDAPAVKWVGNESGEYEITTNYEKDGRGTDIILHITEEETEFLTRSKLAEILDKYCSFMPTEIYLNCDDDAADKEDKPVNDTTPLWQKNSSDCSEADYEDFYKKVFHEYRDPLFHIHINADYPLNFKGILYFPRLNENYDNIEGQVKLYYNQVFVSDNIKEVLPDYLLMLKGVIDCPELPLNVSRSYLQTNTYTSRVSAHIVKKVADKINALYNTERETLENVWDSIKVFVEYACMRDKKFFDRVKDSLLLKLIDDSYATVKEYLDAAKETNENTVYYTTDPALQSQYISLLKDQGIKVICAEKQFEVQFFAHLEQDTTDVKFFRVDEDIAAALKSDKQTDDSNDALASLFKNATKNEKLTVSFKCLKAAKTPAILTVSEESRRLEEMMRMYSGMSEMPAGMEVSELLTINLSSPVIQKLSNLLETDEAKATELASYTYKLALVAHRKLSAEEMTDFLNESYALLETV